MITAQTGQHCCAIAIYYVCSDHQTKLLEEEEFEANAAELT